MRKIIRRGILVTVTAACALGFGLTQASAAPVPPLPAVPELPLTTLTNLPNLTDLGQGLTLSPTLPGAESRSLPVDAGLPIGDIDVPAATSGVPSIDDDGLIPVTDGVDVQGMPGPQVPDLTSVANTVQLPTITTLTPGPQGIGLPLETPVLSGVAVPSAPAVHDLTGDIAPAI
ncbi:MAG: hypothetical protein ABW224_07255 [Kibdelosporangium sp.]